MGRTDSTEPQCLYSTAIPLLTLWAVRHLQSFGDCIVRLYLYPPYGPYEVYRASVPAQYSYPSNHPKGRTDCTVHQCLYSTAITLLTIWAVRPVQSLSLYSTSIPLLTLWAVRTLQSLSSCTVKLFLYLQYGPYEIYRTSVPIQYSYTSTNPMGRTACTEPQCLYSTATPLLPSVPVLYSYTSTHPMGVTVFTELQCLYSTAVPLLPP